MKLRLLQVEDSEDDALLVQRALSRQGFEVTATRVDTEPELAAELERGGWDALVSDYSMPNFSGSTALSMVKERQLDMPFIIVSGTLGEEAAVAAMKAGAHDYLMKSNLTRLGAAIEREVREAEMRRDRRQLEEQFRQAQKMEAVGQLAGGVAHDFNNLLTVILSFSRFVYDDLGDQHPSRDDLREVIECSERATALVRQLLAFSRRQVQESRLVDLGSVVQNAEKMLRRLISEEIAFAIAPADNLWKIRTDHGHMEQVLLNLVVNARDAMPQGGTLRIELANVDLDASYAKRHLGASPGAYVMLAVSDTGSGMSEETQQHIFEPFFTTKVRGKGTGLGLATVYGIVKQCGGDIAVESRLDEGTTFRVYFPRAVETPAPIRGASPSAAATILVVEDQDAVRTVAERALRSAGYQVIEAQTPREAIERATQHPGGIQLAVTDLSLADMSGRELADRLRTVHPELRLLLMSSYADPKLIELAGTGIPYLQKPFTPDLLIHKVRHVLDSPAPT